MALHDDHRSLFKAPPATEAADVPDAEFDHSDEAMRKHRHPFEVPPAEQPHTTPDDPERQH